MELQSRSLAGKEDHHGIPQEPHSPDKVGQIGPNVFESPDSDGDAEHDAEEGADAFPVLPEAYRNARDEGGGRDNLDHISLDTPD